MRGEAAAAREAVAVGSQRAETAEDVLTGVNELLLESRIRRDGPQLPAWRLAGIHLR